MSFFSTHFKNLYLNFALGLSSKKNFALGLKIDWADANANGKFKIKLFPC